MVRKKAVKKRQSAPKSKKKKTRALVSTKQSIVPELVQDDQRAFADDELQLKSLNTDADTDLNGLTPTDPVALYLSELRKYPLLSRDEEYKLAVKYRESGDPLLAQQLVTSNLRFVVKVAVEYSKFGSKLIDLIQEGNVGLMHAVREFNPYKGVRLITYAVWWIRGYIQEYLMKQYSIVKIGTTPAQRKLFYRLQKERELLGQIGKDATPALISSRLGVSEEDVHLMSQRMSGRDVSLNQPLHEDGSSAATLIDLETDNSEMLDDKLGHEEELTLLREQVENLREHLSEKELVILEERLLADEPITLQDIGTRWGVTREAVRQMEERLLNKIRNSLTK